jgi:hypothetical protein
MVLPSGSRTWTQRYDVEIDQWLMPSPNQSSIGREDMSIEAVIAKAYGAFIHTDYQLHHAETRTEEAEEMVGDEYSSSCQCCKTMKESCDNRIDGFVLDYSLQNPVPLTLIRLHRDNKAIHDIRRHSPYLWEVVDRTTLLAFRQCEVNPPIMTAASGFVLCTMLLFPMPKAMEKDIELYRHLNPPFDHFKESIDQFVLSNFSRFRDSVG